MTENSKIKDLRRLGRAVVFLHQQDRNNLNPIVQAEIETILFTGRAMDFAATIHGVKLTDGLIREFAKQAGIGHRQLIDVVLPNLKSADIIDFLVENDEVVMLEEYVKLTGTLLDQTMKVLNAMNPSDVEMAVLHSIEIASWAPLTRSEHLHQLTKRRFEDKVAEDGLNLALAANVNKRVMSPELSEEVIYNPYVWGSGQIKIAAFLRSLPSPERDSLLSICEDAASKPGLALPALTSGTPQMVASARKVGLLQASTVKSSRSKLSQTYVFSPLLVEEDDKLFTTEALHQRKLFVAHILFGHEKATFEHGKIQNPVVLVEALLRKGVVGPASNIATDYHLLERHGIVQVEETSNGRAFLRMVKPEIVEGGLDWLLRTVTGEVTGKPVVRMFQSPSQFVTPEQDRMGLGDQEATDEIARSSVLKLREELQSAARQDTPFS